LVRDKYDNITNLRGFQNPVAILVAEKDEIIPREQAQELYDSLKTQKRMWVFKDSGHNTWPASPREKWWQEVADLLTSNTEH
jgi:esterase/lipase